DDPVIRIWREDSSTDPRRRLDGHRAEAWGLAFSPDSTILASGGDDNAIKLWDIASGRPLATLAGHQGTVTSVAFAPSGDRLASGSLDGTVRIWSLRRGGASLTARAAVLRRPTAPV